MYANGLGTGQDDTAAAEWFSKAANRGHQYAQYALAKLYSQGKGVPQDNGKALMWFQRSAAQGNPYAKYQAAKRILADPAAAPEQRDQAVDWLTEAGFVDRLGRLVLRGWTMPSTPSGSYTGTAGLWSRMPSKR